MKITKLKSKPQLEIFFGGEVLPLDEKLPEKLQSVLDSIEEGNGKINLIDIKKEGRCLQLIISRPYIEMMDPEFYLEEGLIAFQDALLFSGHLERSLYPLPLPNDYYVNHGVKSFWINTLVKDYNKWVNSESWVRGLNVHTFNDRVIFNYDLDLK